MEAGVNITQMPTFADCRAIKFNGGGHINHTLFWENLAPASKGGGGEPTGKLHDMIKEQWGSLEVC